MKSLSVSILSMCLLMTGCGNGGGGEEPNPLDEVPIDRTITIAGLTAPVDMLRDEYGAPHIYCETIADCNRVQGYVHARDRLFQMDMIRRYPQGRLGEIFLPVAPLRPTDREFRRMMMAADGRSVLDHIIEILDEETRSLIQAYTDGVNTYLQDLRDGQSWTRTPDEYGFAFLQEGVSPPEPWTVRDTVALTRLFNYMLSESVGRELYLADLAASLDPELYALLSDSRPMDPTSIVAGGYGAKSRGGRRLPDATRERLRRLRPLVSQARRRWEQTLGLLPSFPQSAGSNSWMIDRAHSSTGNVLFANDPHLELLAPPFWCDIHMIVAEVEGVDGEQHSWGLAFPGTPAVVTGQTERLAWVSTTTGYDVTDLYEETLVRTATEEDAVMFNGQEVPIQKVIVSYRLGPDSGADTEDEKVCLVPHHGPIIEVEGFSQDELVDPDGPCFDPDRGQKAISVKWQGRFPSLEVSAVRGIILSKNIDEAEAALDNWDVGAQNWLLTDRDSGTIVYYPAAEVPIRDGDLQNNPPWLPLPGDGEYEWTGYVPSEELPRVRNPEKGFIVTANNDLAGLLTDGDPLNDRHYLYLSNAHGLRAGRITRLLEEAMQDDGKVSPEESQAIQFDHGFELAALMLPYLFEVADANPDQVTALGVGDYLQRLRDWGLATPTGLAGSDPDGPISDSAAERDDAVAASIFSAWFIFAVHRTFIDELVAAGMATDSGTPTSSPYNHNRALYSALRDGNDRFFDDVRTAGQTETRADIFLGSLTAAATYLEERFQSGNPDDWLWGRIHLVKFNSFFGSFGVPNDFDLGPYANVGGLYTINVAGWGRPFDQNHGASTRILGEMKPDGSTSRQVLPGGNIDDLGHANRSDQVPMWLENGYRRMPYTREEVRDAALARKELLTGSNARWRFEPPL